MAKRGRKPKVRFFPSKGGFYVTIDGVRHCLAKCAADDAPDGPHYQEALRQYKSLITLDENKGTDEMSLVSVINAYRLMLEGKNKTSELLNVNMLRGFSDRHGKKKISELRVFMFEDWLAGTDYADNSRRLVIGLLQTILNWAERREMIERNPFAKKIDLPRAKGKGREARIPAELCSLLISHAKRDYKDILTVMRLTGCRPEEIEQAECQHYNPETKRIVFRWNATEGYKHKQALRGKKKDRTIYLTDELAEMIEAKIVRRKTGRIFRSTYGKNMNAVIRFKYWKILKSKPAIVTYCKEKNIDIDKLVPYNLRHTFISEMLDKGISIKLLADMVGTSVQMIEEYYGYPDEDNLHDVYRHFLKLP